MQSLKDSLSDHKKTVTLSASQIDFLSQIHGMVQGVLNQLQEKIAAAYLHELAIREFGMDKNKDFNFEYHPEREYDNLTITEKIIGK